MSWINRFWIGMICGVLIPIVFMYIFASVYYKGEITFFELLKHLAELKAIPPFIAVSVVPNLLIFYFLINREYWKASRGVIMSSVILAIAVFSFFVK